MKKIIVVLIYIFILCFYIFTNIDKWEPIDGSIGDTPMITVITQMAGNNNIAFAGYSNGAVYKTYDANNAEPVWEEIISKNDYSINGGHMVTSIAVNPHDVNEIYISFEGERYGAYLWKTIDGGDNWFPIYSVWGRIWNISFNPLNTNIMYIITDGYVYISEDGGYNWNNTIENDPLDLVLEDDETVSIVYISTADKNHVIAGTSKGNIFETHNVAGIDKNWQYIRQADGSDNMPLKPVVSLALNNNQNYIYAVFENNRWLIDNNMDGIWLKDMNNIWKNIHKANITRYHVPVNISVNPYYNEVLYACVYSEYGARSINNGEFWSRYSNGSGNNIRVLYRDGDHQEVDNNHIKPHIVLENYGTVDVLLNEITIKYWFTVDSKDEQVLVVDYALIGKDNIKGEFIDLYNPPFSYPKNNADYCLQVGFKGSNLILSKNGNTGELQLRFNKIDWSNYNELNDYSYMSTDWDYYENYNITLYRNGKLIWGIEPDYIK